MLLGFIALPVFARIALVALVAILVARFINWAIYNWAYFRRSLGPWAAPPKGGVKHTFLDHLPVFGWLRLRRECGEHGKIYWIRPLLIELVFPVAIAWYYHFYVSGGTLSIRTAAALMQPELHCQFAGHLVLLVLMAIATFIDFDEHSIPDYVTIPGTVIGLLGAAVALAWLPFELVMIAGQPAALELQANAPSVWPPVLNGVYGLVFALVILGVWGFALLERRWISRRGLRKGVTYFFARMFRNRSVWIPVLSVTVCLMAGVILAWWSEIARWQFLLSSLFGLAFAGGVTWAVRLSASWGLGVEALGFGDVTLMAMIGTYIGWQPSLIVFFLAPLVAIVFVLIRKVITGESTTPYGPYLCAATVLLLVLWDALWTRWAAPMFNLGAGFFLGTVVACVVLMGAMLWIWRLIKQALGIQLH